MKFFSTLILIAIICPHQISAFILKIDAIVVSGSNPGSFPALKNALISKNLNFNINETLSLKDELTTQLNNNNKLKKNWPFPNCVFAPINLKIFVNKKFLNFNFDTQPDVFDKNSNDLDLLNAIEKATKITLSINITKSNLD